MRLSRCPPKLPKLMTSFRNLISVVAREAVRNVARDPSNIALHPCSHVWARSERLRTHDPAIRPYIEPCAGLWVGRLTRCEWWGYGVRTFTVIENSAEDPHLVALSAVAAHLPERWRVRLGRDRARPAGPRAVSRFRSHRCDDHATGGCTRRRGGAS